MELNAVTAIDGGANTFTRIESQNNSSSTFESIMSQLQAVDQSYRNAENAALSLVAGDLDNLHQVMAAINKAKLQFEFVTEVRNKALEGYQEIMRMQV